MIVIKLKGGLGNQLFQYAYGRALAADKKDALRFEVSWYRRFYKSTGREYALKQFNLVGRPLSFFERLQKPAALQGLWQSENYFKHIEPLIRQELTLKSQPSQYFIETKKKIENCNAVSLHIRRGDYASNARVTESIGLVPISYYDEAIAKIAVEVSAPTFFIFSDDIEWVKENLRLPYQAEYIAHPQQLDHEELLLMAACEHHIIANSTFSWWGAWLNPNPQKIVIAPEQWFKDAALNADAGGIVPASWVKI